MSSTSTHPYQSGLPWLRRWLSGQPHQTITGDTDPTDRYLLRWYVIPRNPLLNVYVHKFLRSDDDRALHDHPWWFVSLILRGRYDEITDSGRHVRRPWSIAYRPAEWRHRVALFPYRDGELLPCWTLIVTGPRRREWGFWCKQRNLLLQHHLGDRFVPWTQWGPGGCGEVS